MFSRSLDAKERDGLGGRVEFDLGAMIEALLPLTMELEEKERFFLDDFDFSGFEKQSEVELIFDLDFSCISALSFSSNHSILPKSGSSSCK